MSAAERSSIESALRKYCELDTLAMVMILRTLEGDDSMIGRGARWHSHPVGFTFATPFIIIKKKKHWMPSNEEDSVTPGQDMNERKKNRRTY